MKREDRWETRLVQRPNYIYIYIKKLQVQIFLVRNNEAHTDTYRKSGESWNPLPGWRGLSGKRSSPSFTLLLGLGVASACNPPFLSASIFFLTLPRRFSNLLVSMVIALWTIDEHPVPACARACTCTHRDNDKLFAKRAEHLPSARLARFRVAIDHPPGTFPSALVLHPHESAVQRQVVSYRVLQTESKFRIQTRKYDMTVNVHMTSWSLIIDWLTNNSFRWLTNGRRNVFSNFITLPVPRFSRNRSVGKQGVER